MAQRWIIVCICLVAMEEVSSKSRNMKCDAGEIMSCRVEKKENLIFPDTLEKLQDHCENLMSEMDCVKRIIDECVNEEDKNKFHNLTRGRIELNDELCTPGSSLSIRYLRHAECLNNLSDRFKDDCSYRYIYNAAIAQGLSEEEQRKMICCTVHENSKCVINVVEGRCEEDARKLVEETLVTTLKRPFGFCKHLDGIPTRNCMRSFSGVKGYTSNTLENVENNGDERDAVEDVENSGDDQGTLEDVKKSGDGQGTLNDVENGADGQDTLEDVKNSGVGQGTLENVVNSVDILHLPLVLILNLLLVPYFVGF